MPDLGVELWLVFVVIGKSAVDLCQRQMRMLEVNLLRAPTIRHLIQNNFRDLYFRAGNPCHTLTIKFDLRGEDGGHWFTHGFKYTLAEPRSKRAAAICSWARDRW